MSLTGEVRSQSFAWLLLKAKVQEVLGTEEGRRGRGVVQEVALAQHPLSECKPHP